MAPAHVKRKVALNSYYSLHPNCGDACAYCGVVADTYDHCPPLSVVHQLGISHFEDNHIRLYLIPCCRECNSILGADGGQTMTERKKMVKAKLRRRYAKVLAMPHWTEDEIAELGYNLRAVIESGENIKEWVRRRIAW